jgi:uncharacterized membrane protein YeaQ/YmgE (transglycosylase-associated protein family)
MNIASLVIYLCIGAFAGWLAGSLIRGGGFGLWINMAIGIVGSVIGGFLFGLLGLSANGLVGAIITAFVGAAILLFLAGLLKKVR